MDPATQSSAITALAAIAGSIVGGLASFLTTYFTQRHQAHRDLLSREAAHREELYSQFIKEAANVYVDSLDKTLESPASLVGVYSLVSRIRLVSNDTVLAAAEKVVDVIVESYHRPPTTFDTMVTMVREGKFDPLREFTEACREERKAMLKPM
jgi:metal-responsive CopG/Arc/MetJ family transcriptional regulator